MLTRRGFNESDWVVIDGEHMRNPVTFAVIEPHMPRIFAVIEPIAEDTVDVPITAFHPLPYASPSIPLSAVRLYGADSLKVAR